MGLGEDFDFHLAITRCISTVVVISELNSTCGGEAKGSQEVWRKSFGPLLNNVLKNSSAVLSSKMVGYCYCCYPESWQQTYRNSDNNPFWPSVGYFTEENVPQPF